MRGIIWLRTSVNNDVSSRNLAFKLRAAFMYRFRARHGIRLVISPVGLMIFFALQADLIVHKSMQNGLDDIILEGIGTPAEWVMNLTIVKGRKNRFVGAQGWDKSLDSG